MSSSNLFPDGRYLPPPIRTHNYQSSSGSGLSRAASFLNQDWNSTGSNRYRLSTKAVFPPRSTSSDEDDDDFDRDFSVKRENISPLSFSARLSISPPAESQRRHPATWDIHRPVLPPALHPSASQAMSTPNSPTLPPIATLSNHIRSRSDPHCSSSTVLSSSSSASPSPSSFSSLTPASSTVKSEPSSSAIPYSNNHTLDVDSYVRKTDSPKAMCVWPHDGDSVCGFESSGSLVKRHIRTVHLKIRPVTCPVCHQGFSTKFHLKTHANIHTGLKPYDCPECGKKFSNPSSKHHHRVRYHGYVQTWRHYGDKSSTNR